MGIVLGLCSVVHVMFKCLYPLRIPNPSTLLTPGSVSITYSTVNLLYFIPYSVIHIVML